MKGIARIIKWVMIGLLAVTISAEAKGDNQTGNRLVLVKDSTAMYVNGQYVKADRPMMEQDFINYASARSIIEQLGGTITYDRTNEVYRLETLGYTAEYRLNSKQYVVNGTRMEALGAPLLSEGRLMLPVRTVVQSFGLSLKSQADRNQFWLEWEAQPVADFKIEPQEIFAGKTEIRYIDQSYHPYGLSIMQEEWVGKKDRFENPGTYTITRRVQDIYGIWSEPYSQTINVIRENEPPVAHFVTDKVSYRMGEAITYRDMSTDDEGRIEKREWTNKQPAFFKPGVQTITLKVTDAHGASSTYTHTIQIRDEQLYSKQEFDLLFTEPGDKFGIGGASVLQMPTVSYTAMPDNRMTLFRSNSPETIVDEGIYYEDTLTGNIRFLAHHYNSRQNPVRVYLVATNTSDQDAYVQVEHMGMGGPAEHVVQSGKMSVGRYLLSRQNSDILENVRIPAKGSRLLVTQLSDSVLANDRVLTVYADIKTPVPIKLQVVVLDDNKDVMSELPKLPILAVDGKHVRGTFHQANRVVDIRDAIGGEQSSRMIIGDRQSDVGLSGIDQTTGLQVRNDGNNGALYTFRLQRVQPNTLIALNARGGHYSGAFMIDGRLVYSTTANMLDNNNEAAVLYRTGAREESLNITFVPASGSNMPINLLFLPLPERKK